MHEAAAREVFAADVANLPRLAAVRGWTVYATDYPRVDVGFLAAGRRELRLSLHAPDWNDTPPSIALLHANGQRLPADQVPQHGVFNRGDHPNTGHPFVCMAGSLEYHTHSSHLNDHWSNYRERSSHTLVGIINQLWNAWLKAPA